MHNCYSKNPIRRKKETLKKYGATLIEVDAVPYSNPKNYIKQSKQIALEQAKNNKNGVFGQINLTILLIQKRTLRPLQRKYESNCWKS